MHLLYSCVSNPRYCIQLLTTAVSQAFYQGEEGIAKCATLNTTLTHAVVAVDLSLACLFSYPI